MREGFYRVTHAPRWAGEFHVGSGRVAFASINETKEFDGLVGYFDERMVELSKALSDITQAKGGVSWRFIGDDGDSMPGMRPHKGYNTPIVFSNQAGRLWNRTSDPFLTTFFARQELEAIEETEAEKAIGKLMMRRYGDLKVMETYSKDLGHWYMKIITPDSPPANTMPALSDIPWYIPHTSRREVERIIELSKRVYKGEFDSIDETFQASAVM